MTKKKRTKRPPNRDERTSRPAAKSGGLRLQLVLTGVPAGLALLVTLYGYYLSSASIPASLTRGAASGFNVLLITLDTTRADRLGCYGYNGAATPTLDGLAKEGVRFDDAIAHTPMTLPSHASMLTGLEPPNHGVRINEEYRLDPSFTTLAEVLKSHGYDTSAFISAFVLDARFGLDQGFDHYDANVDPSTGLAFGRYNQRDARSVTSAAIKWFADRDSNKPFFTWVHYFDPHEPYRPPEPFLGRFRSQPYDGEIAYMDSQIARLLKTLEKNNLRRNTIILVVGDHGESLQEHNEPTHSFFIYDATQRVPLILSCQALFETPVVVEDVVVAISDVFPTVLELLGLDFNGKHDGISLLEAHAHPNRAVYVETLHTYLNHGWAPLYGLRRHTDKFIQAPRPEYYDLRTDPGEQANLFTRSAPRQRKAIAELAEALSEKIENAPPLDRVRNGATPIDIETSKRLEALGYVSGVSPDGSLGVLDPKDMIRNWTLVRRSQMLTETGQLDEALVIVENALTRSPRDRNALQQLGEIHALAGRFEEAERALQANLEIKPSANVCVLLAQILMRQQQYDAAKALLLQATELEPEHGGVYIAQADLLVLSGKLREAIPLYQRAGEIDPYRAAGMAEFKINRVRAVLEQTP